VLTACDLSVVVVEEEDQTHGSGSEEGLVSHQVVEEQFKRLLLFLRVVLGLDDVLADPIGDLEAAVSSSVALTGDEKEGTYADSAKASSRATPTAVSVARWRARMVSATGERTLRALVASSSPVIASKTLDKLSACPLVDPFERSSWAMGRVCTL
jgi:hypothetical protein